MTYTADGKLDDARDVVIGATNASLFAYVADGSERLEGDPAHVAGEPAQFLRLLARPQAGADRLVSDRARRRWRCRAGLERDRGVDETGHQIAVFGRIGSRPFTLDEMKKLYLGADGKLFTVTDRVRTDDFVPAPARPRGKSAQR